MPSNSPARARFAPSPTGRFHIGGARTALYDFLLARQTGGQFILRIEDTDQKRFDPKAEREMMDSLKWLGLEWDEGPDVGGPSGPYRQSERKAIYARYANELVRRGHAYVCFCSSDRLAQMRQEQQKHKQPPRYDGLCRELASSTVQARLDSGEPHVIRLKTPRQGQTTAVDHIRGPITVENADLDDFILMKSDGLPVYHLAAMVDDREMRITHVLRSSEWLPTFPLHVLIYEAFDWAQPVWVHLSVFLNPSGKGKMSKRHAVDPKGGVASIFPLDMRDLGYLPEAVVNWLALMGWSYDDHTELFSMADLIDRFSLAKLTPSPAAVNFGKLDHFNGLYIRGLPEAELARRLQPFLEQAGLAPATGMVERIAPLIRERIRTLEESVEIAGFFFRDDVRPSDEQLPGKDLEPALAAAAARRAIQVIESAAGFDEALEASLRALADELGLSAGALFGLLRLAVTGQPVSPPLLESMAVIGKRVVVSRIDGVASRLEALPA
jgi:glutamyl-tRNA synthetase